MSSTIPVVTIQQQDKFIKDQMKVSCCISLCTSTIYTEAGIKSINHSALNWLKNLLFSYIVSNTEVK